MIVGIVIGSGIFLGVNRVAQGAGRLAVAVQHVVQVAARHLDPDRAAGVAQHVV